MKKLIRILILTALLGSVSLFIIFFFYAKSPNWDTAEYYRILEFDSIYSTLKDTLTICSYNLGYLSGMTNNLPVENAHELYLENMVRVIALFSKLDPDVLALQEVDYDSDRSHRQDQLAEMVTTLKYPTAYRSVNWDKTYVPFPYWPISRNFGQIVSGQAIVAKYPMTNAQTKVLEMPLTAPPLYNDFYIDRLVQLLDLNIGDRVVKIMNVHLEAFDQATRLRQAEKVKEIFESFEDVPVILMGDFNDSPIYSEHPQRTLDIIMSAKNIESAVSELAFSLDPKAFYTYSSGHPERMLDHIFYNKKFMTTVHVRVVKEAGQISDHLPLIAKLVFKE